MKVPRKSAQSRLGFHFLLLFSANGKTIFGNDDDRRKLNEIVGEVIAELRVRVHAHCWLNNEIELVAETGVVAPERLIRKIASAYSAAVGGRLGRNGTLFSDTHICYEPETQSELVDIVRSMHVRPIVLDLAEDSESYPWSSARAYGGLEELPWLTKDILGPLLQRGASGESQGAGAEPRAQTAPGMIADAVEAKLSRETVDRSRVWMARALIAWIVTRDGVRGEGIPGGYGAVSGEYGPPSAGGDMYERLSVRIISTLRPNRNARCTRSAWIATRLFGSCPTPRASSAVSATLSTCGASKTSPAPGFRTRAG